jgi:hypothetical protein
LVQSLLHDRVVKGHLIRGACASLTLVLALSGCDEAPEITIDSSCIIGEWSIRPSHTLIIEDTEPKDSYPLVCVPADAISSEGTLRCVGLLRAPTEELPEGCETLGLEPWEPPAEGAETTVCVLPWVEGDAEPPPHGFVFVPSDECVDRAETPFSPRLTPLPFELPGRAELRCQVTDDPACAWE